MLTAGSGERFGFAGSAQGRGRLAIDRARFRIDRDAVALARLGDGVALRPIGQFSAVVVESLRTLAPFPAHGPWQVQVLA